MGIRKKESTLYFIFLKYLAKLAFLIAILFIILIGIVWTGFETKVILPANYGQNEFFKLKNESFENKDFNGDIIPYPCEYLFFYNDGRVEGNIEGKMREDAILFKEGKYVGQKKLFGITVYDKLNFKDGECIVNYNLIMYFGSAELENLLPNPSNIISMLGIIIIIGSSIFIAIRFGKLLKKEMYPLISATEKIKNRDLEFEILKSRVKEFNNILVSVEDMKEDLKEALSEQWRLEKEKEDSISALAHDIRTPLTIIRGNAELLLDNNTEDNDNEELNYIIKNSEKIERYLELLMDISISEKGVEVKKDVIDLREMADEMRLDTEMICSRKNIKCTFNFKYKSKEIIGNKAQLIRAVNNVVSNGVEYSLENNILELNIIELGDNFIFEIKDNGCGFTEEGIKNAMNKFYMGNSGRAVGKHYGLGLHIVSSIAKKHGGYLKIENREDKEGAKISIVIRKNKVKF